MRRVRYGVGISLDGYIAGPAGLRAYVFSRTLRPVDVREGAA